MVALAQTAGVALDRGLAGSARHAGGLVVGVAHPRCRPLAQHGFQRGAGLGIQKTVDLARPVAGLALDGQIAFARPVGVGGFDAVLVDQRRQPIGGLAQLGRPQPGGDPGQIGLGGPAGLIVDTGRQLVEEPLDDRHVLGSDITTPLGGGDIGQLGR